MDHTASTRELGEFGLIARLTSGLPVNAGVIVGVGDDAAVLTCPPDTDAVATCDAQVEGRHFVSAVVTPEQVGRKALAVNLSDIAAMGATPRAALVSLMLPAETPIEWLDGLYGGLRAEAAEFGVAIIGGNVAATSGPLIVDVTLLGQVARGRAVLRSGGGVGDRLYVTGTLGAAAAGLLTFGGRSPTGREVVDSVLAEVRAAHLTPQPRVNVGIALANTGAITAMLDVSDGLAADLAHLCARSEVGALVDSAALPIDAATRAVAVAYGRDPLELAMSGGEDYELLFAARAGTDDAVAAAVAAAGGTARAIGWLTEPALGMRVRGEDGAEAQLLARGWDHLMSPT